MSSLGWVLFLGELHHALFLAFSWLWCSTRAKLRECLTPLSTSAWKPLHFSLFPSQNTRGKNRWGRSLKCRGVWAGSPLQTSIPASPSPSLSAPALDLLHRGPSPLSLFCVLPPSTCQHLFVPELFWTSTYFHKNKTGCVLFPAFAQGGLPGGDAESRGDMRPGRTLTASLLPTPGQAATQSGQAPLCSLSPHATPEPSWREAAGWARPKTQGLTRCPRYGEQSMQLTVGPSWHTAPQPVLRW